MKTIYHSLNKYKTKIKKYLQTHVSRNLYNTKMPNLNLKS